MNLSDRLPAVEITERTPEEETLVMRLRVFTNMRWFAVLGVIIVTLMAKKLSSYILHPIPKRMFETTAELLGDTINLD